MRSSKSRSKKTHVKSSKRIAAAKEENKSPTENLKKNGPNRDDTKEMAANLNFDISKVTNKNPLFKEQHNGSSKSDSISASKTALEQKDTISITVPKPITKIESNATKKVKRSKYEIQLFKIFKKT